MANVSSHIDIENLFNTSYHPFYAFTFHLYMSIIFGNFKPQAWTTFILKTKIIKSPTKRPVLHDSTYMRYLEFS
jgi:hypothetical protein